jgi:hypothetical protein
MTLLMTGSAAMAFEPGATAIAEMSVSRALSSDVPTTTPEMATNERDSRSICSRAMM